MKTGAPDQRLYLATATGRYDLEAEAVWLGRDLLVSIWGGQIPHIGAVAAAQPRPSLQNADRTSATASVLAYVGHKEDAMAKEAAEALAAALETRVVVTAGAHWDEIDEAGIQAVLANSKLLVARLIAALKNEEG